MNAPDTSTRTTTPGSVPNIDRDIRSRRWRMLVDGDLVEASDGGTDPVVDPSTGEVVTQAPHASGADVDRAVGSARKAFGAWSALSVPERAVHLRAFAQLLEEHAEELAFIDALDSGNPIAAMRNEVAGALVHIDRWCGLALGLNGQVLPASKGNLHYTTNAPYGVVARIVPFNHPQLFASTRILAPLLAGNTVVLKAADQTPLSALAIGELLQQAFPPGVVSVLTGGGDVGGALVAHPDIRRIGFIGSVATGRLIQRTAAEHAVKNVSLELGGKNALIAFPDADFDAAVQGALTGMNFGVSQGQSCGSTSRVFVHSSMYRDFVDALAERMSTIRVGVAYDESTEMGPVVSQAQLDKDLYYVAEGRREGARLVVGGDRPDGLDGGYFLAPTLFADVRPDMRIAQEEIFGPVVAVSPWDDYETVIEQANGVEYGLTSSIWTRDLVVAHRTAARMDSGYVWINDSSTHYWGTPFGGFKESGLGREESIEELLSYTQQKVTHVKMGDAGDAVAGLLNRAR